MQKKPLFDEIVYLHHEEDNIILHEYFTKQAVKDVMGWSYKNNCVGDFKIAVIVWSWIMVAW